MGQQRPFRDAPLLQSSAFIFWLEMFTSLSSNSIPPQ
jgi:hypothetical protein